MDYRDEKIGGDGHVAIHDWEAVDLDGHLKDTTEIEKEINETRHTMDILVDALTNKLRPGTVVDKLVKQFQLPENRKKVQDAFINGGRRISESFQRDPFPLLFIGVGIAWLFLEQQTAAASLQSENAGGSFPQSAEDIIDKKKSAAREKYADAKENLSSAVDKARERIAAGSKTIKDTLADMKERTSEYVRSGSQSGGQVSEKYHNAADTIIGMYKERPLAVGIAAAMVGMAAGILIPESKIERQKVGSTAKASFEEAKERGQEAWETGKQALQETAEAGYDKTMEKSQEEISKIKNERVQDTSLHEDKKQPAALKQQEVEKSVKNEVTSNIENVEVNLKEKSDEKIARKDRSSDKS
jgi:ElaB/YqjD/DUF883 family membrane-anchored ribosome-binding protein